MKKYHQIVINNVIVPYTVLRSSRRKKTVQIRISGGAVVVSAPVRAPNREIQAIVEKRGEWIFAKLNEAPTVASPLRLVTGEVLPVFGIEVPLVVVESDVRRPGARTDTDRMLVEVPSGLPGEEKNESVYAALVVWYKQQAAEFLEQSVADWLPRMGRSEMPRVLVREQRTRWGSCSADGTLRFSWRLAMVEPELVESVVVHELAHLDVMNHSKAFWDVVERAMPDAKKRRKILNEAGRRLPL